jgi:geranylgeranyl pyrophosphate synthase
MEIIHTGTIIHDDINDRSLLRRGVPTAYRKFGTTSALLSGDYLFVKAFEAVSEYEKDVRDIVINSCVLLAQGEIIQSQSTGDITLTEEDYMDIIMKKTASPISAGAKVGGMLAGASAEDSNALMEYGLNLGIGFQIIDDVLDVTGVETQTGKYSGNDIQEGKTTLLPIHALNNSSPEDQSKLKAILISKEKDRRDITEAIAIITTAGSIDYARSLSLDYIEKAKASIDNVEDSEWKERLIQLADFVVERVY